MKKIFITGATGFIGKNLLKRLLEQENRIYVLVFQDELERIPTDERIVPVVGNLNEVSSIEGQLDGIDIDIIFHLAWEGVSTTYKNDFELQMKNIRYAMNVMEIARKHHCSRVVMTGSISEYAYRETIDDTVAPAPSDFYSATKAAIHIYCDFYSRLYEEISLNWAIISSIYGPGRTDNNIITYTIRSLLNDQDTEYTKLEQQWDYVYIDDVVEALVLVASKGKPGAMYQVGSGEVKPLSEYIKDIKTLIPTDAVLGIGKIPYKTKQIDNSVVDISKLVEDTGYQPKVSFEEGIRRTISYFEEMEKSNV